jgi:S1-C subfamily serine protease
MKKNHAFQIAIAIILGFTAFTCTGVRQFEEPQAIDTQGYPLELGKTPTLPQIFKAIAPSVVVIYSLDAYGDTISQGSGFFINEKGHFITNWHVVEDAYDAKVKLYNGKSFEIDSVISADYEGDLIVLSSQELAKYSKPAQIAKELPEIGEDIIVIGSPLGFEYSISEGIISSIRKIPEFGNFIQISAAISPGSSGSPVVNMKGQVVGIATAQNIEGQNINFAMPSERLDYLDRQYAFSLDEWLYEEDDSLTEYSASVFSGMLLIFADMYKQAIP